MTDTKMQRGAYVDRVELEHALHEHDSEIRGHYDKVFANTMDKIADTEKALAISIKEIGSSFSRNIKWTIVIMVSLMTAYIGAIVSIDISDKESQKATDEQQTGQILQAWKAIERTAAIVGEHSESSKRELDKNSEGIQQIRQETSSRIHQLEIEQRNRDRQN